MKRVLAFVFLTLLTPVARAQADDLAAERTRLANQRIEAEARAREEQDRQAAGGERVEAIPRQAVPPAAIEPRNVASETPALSAEIAPVGVTRRETARPPGDVERMLEQIWTLGELRDAGYVTDTEFDRIKQRILDGTL